jgi:hypothetical protein
MYQNMVLQQTKRFFLPLNLASLYLTYISKAIKGRFGNFEKLCMIFMTVDVDLYFKVLAFLKVANYKIGSFLPYHTSCACLQQP